MTLGPNSFGRVQRGKQFRSVGWLGALAGIAGIALSKLAVLDPGAAVLGAAILAPSLLLINWTRLWVRESKEPFQYTFSVGEFEFGPVPGETVAGTPIPWLRRDLTERLSTRVARLSLFEDADVPATEPEGEPAPHVHISGWHGIRHEGGRWILELVPQVRLGGEGSPTKLAQTVRFRLPESFNGTKAPLVLDDEQQYRRLLERVYWSVASQIYAQIRRGVERKVKLLPPGRLRAAAYLHEADDYAASNTLDAYAAARELYLAALETYDVSARPRSATRPRQFVVWLRRGGNAISRLARRWRTLLLRRSGRRAILTARAQLGYARMLVAEWHLKFLCGRMPEDIYGARPLVQRAIERLESIPADVGEQESTLFRAYVTLATVSHYIDDGQGARQALVCAERVSPKPVHGDAEFLFVTGMVEPKGVRALRRLGESAELDPLMERARIERALRYEDLWRRNERLEESVAETVDGEFAKVITINPGNVGAWASRGYVAWLMAIDRNGQERRVLRGRQPWRQRGVDALEAGRQYKEVRGETIVAELDWNLARFAAERGDFASAYAHYIEAVSALLAEPRMAFEGYFYNGITAAIVARFAVYREVVETQAENARMDPDKKRLVGSVMAFVRNDCGLAYLARHERTGDLRELVLAQDCFDKAIEANPTFMLAAYNQARAEVAWAAFAVDEESYVNRLENARGRLVAVLRGEPNWDMARLELVTVETWLWEIVERQRSELAYGNARVSPAARPGEELASERPRETGLLRAWLDWRRLEYVDRLEAHLRRLLPSKGPLAPRPARSLFDPGDLGAHRAIAGGEKRPSQSLSEIEALALVFWARALTNTAPVAADNLQAALLRDFAPGDQSLIETRRYVAITEARNATESEKRHWDGIIEQADSALRTLAAEALQRDPGNHRLLGGIAALDPREQRLAVEEARTAGLSETSLIQLTAQRAEVKDEAIALALAEEALAVESGAAGAREWLRLGTTLESLGAGTMAIAALRRAIDVADPDGTPEATRVLEPLLIGLGQAEAANRELRRAGVNPACALVLGSKLEEEGRPLDAVRVYFQAVVQAGGKGPEGPEAQLRLGRLKSRLGETSAALTHLEAASTSDDEGVRRAANLSRLEILATTDPVAARRFGESLIAGDDTQMIAAGALQIAELGEGEDKTDEFFRYLAGQHSWLALRLGDDLFRRNRPAATLRSIYEQGALTTGATAGFAADAALRILDLAPPTDTETATEICQLAIGAGENPRAAPEAVLRFAELIHPFAESAHMRAKLFLSLGEGIWNGPGASPAKALAFCRELLDRLGMTGDDVTADAFYRALVRIDRTTALRIATLALMDNDTDKANRMRLQIAAAPPLLS